MSAFYLTGALLILHAAYSSFEFHQLVKTTAIPSAGSTLTGTASGAGHLPYDIVLEVIIALALFVAGSINSIRNQPVLPIKVGQDGDGLKAVTPDDAFCRPIRINRAMDVLNKVGINDYEEFDNRVDFIDIGRKRRLYNDWINRK